MKKIKVVLLATMSLFAFVVNAQQKTVNEEYPSVNGNLRFNKYQANFQNIKNTETKTDTLKMINTFSKSLTLSFTKVPDYITCKVVPEILKPNQKGYILITYNATKRNDFGQVSEYVTLTTNDSLQAVKQIYVVADIMEDFSKFTPEQMANAPKISFEKSTFDFGTINQGDKIEHDFSFTNTGKSDLIIRKTKGSCGCTVGTPEKSTLKPGESTNLHVVFNSAGKSGQQNKTVTITNNDPANSSAVITLVGTVNVKKDTGENKTGEQH